MIPGRVSWPLIGRDAEMDTLAQAFAHGGSAAVIAGAAGVGRSRLAREAGELVARSGRTVRCAAASTAAAAVPLGALAHLLPPAPSGAGDTELIAHAAAALAGDRDEQPPVLIVDDAQLLDPLTVTLLHRLVAGGAVTLVAVVPAAGPDPLAELWMDDQAARIDLGPLSRPHTEQLLDAVLDERVDSRTVEQLWRLTHGNPRVLRELVDDGRTTGQLAARDGLWRWSGPMEPGARLTRIVLAQLASTGPAQRAALEVLAVAGPLPLRRYAELVGRPTMAALERAALVAVDRPTDVPGAARVRTAQPVHAAVLARQLPAAEADRVRRLVVSEDPRAVGSPAELLLAGRMALDGETDDVDPVVLVAAAQEAAAQADHALAERLARAAVSAGGTAEARIAWVEALQWQGRAADAERAAQDGHDGRDDPRMTAVRAVNLQLGLHRPDDARRLLDDAGPDGTGLLPGIRAMLELRAGAVAAAVELGGRVLADPAAVAGHPYAAAAAGAGLAVQGHPQDALAAVAAGSSSWPAAHDGQGPGLEVLALEQARLIVLLHAGRLDELVDAAAALHRRSLAGAASARDSIAALHCGGAALATGRLDLAARLLTEAEHGLARCDPLHLRPVGVAWLATVRALRGEPSAAQRLLTDLGDDDVLFRPQVLRARAWAAAAAQRAEEAAHLALAAADQAALAGQRALQAGLLHDVVRLGRAADAAAPLRALAGVLDTPLVHAAADHADAVVDPDPKRLDAVSTRFEQLGALLAAADAAADAASLHHLAGHRRRSAAAGARATVLARRCGDPRTPALVHLSAPRLTAREQHVARLAASGLSNQAIAGRLVVSVRTVETHLAHAYTKLGVAGRGELSDALALR